MDDDDAVREVGADAGHTPDALDALRAWLLTEDAHERGGVPDEVLVYLQDHVDRLLGPGATLAAGDVLRRHVGAGGDLADLARDRPALLDLLASIEGERRPDPELEWRADRPASPTGEAHRPAALLVMAEHGVGDPVWDRPRGSGEPVSLTELDVSDSLVQRLRAWNGTYERSAPVDGWASSEAGAEWVRQGLALARELQQELPDVDVRYSRTGDDRPLRRRP